MKAAVLSGIHQVGLQEVPKPSLVNDTDVIIKISATMICTSEVHYAEGFLPPCPPFVMGHEFVGVIDEVGTQVRNFKVGDRVIAPCYPFCGVCDMCRKGVSGLCPNGALFGSGEGWGNMSGGLAEYVRAPLADSALCPIPDSVSDEQAVFVSDMLGTGYFGVSNAELKPEQTVAIIGAGPVGLGAVLTARLYSPANIIVIGRRENRLATALKMGATHVVDTATHDPTEEVLRITNGVGADAVIDSVGSVESLESVPGVLGIGGIVSILGFPPFGKFEIPLQALMFRNATLKLGVTDQANMPFLMGLVEKGKIDVSPLLTHTMPLTDFDKAFDMFANKRDNCIKVLLRP